MKKVLLKNIAFIINGFPCKKEFYSLNNKYIPIIRIQNMNEESNDKIYYSGKYDPKSLVQKGDILFSLSGTIKTFIWPKEESLLNQRIVKIIPKEEETNPKYLYYFLASKTNYIAQKGKKSIINNVSVNYLNNLEINDLTIEKQTEIVLELDNINKSIKNRRATLKDFEEFIDSKFEEMFGNPISNDKKWKYEKLGNLSKLYSGGTPSRKTASYFLGKIPWITTVSLNKRYINYEDACEYITEEGIKNSATKLIKSGAILFGTRVGVGKMSINNTDICTNQDIISIQEFEKCYNSIFLMELLKKFSAYYIMQKRGSTIQGIQSSVLKNMVVIIPPLDLQEKFAKFVLLTEEYNELIQQDIKDLELLLGSKMHEYFD